MSTKVHYVSLAGGLDGIHSPVVMSDGRMIGAENYEEVFGLQGYRRIYGYERYDGHTQPHTAQYYTIAFITGSAVIAAGDTITGATSGATGKVVGVTLESGSWVRGNAAGYLVVYDITGTFVAAENLQVSASTKAVCHGTQVINGIGDTHYAESKLLTVTAARAEISAVPGSGGILGAGVYNGVVYAARNAADGLTAAIYKSSATGWLLVQGGLIPNGDWYMDVANFTGSAKTLSLFGVDGKNPPFYYNGTTYDKITGLWDTDATSVSSVVIGTGAKTFVVTEPGMVFVVGQDLTVWDGADAANWMRGTVTSWTPETSTLEINITSVGGSGTKTSWSIGMSDFSDKPFFSKAHKNHMLYAYPGGQLLTSDIGDPLVAGATSDLFGTGDEITGLLKLKTDNLAIYCRNRIYILSGSSQLDWNLDMYSSVGGAILDTAAEVAGVGIHIDEGGVKSLQATQMYGNYEPSTLSREVAGYVTSISPTIVACHGHKKSQQYRVYSNTGKVLVCTITTPNALITPEDVSFSILNYPHKISCAITGEMVDGTEMHLFGTSDGYVMRESVGTSFDGAVLSSVMRLPFNNFKAASNKKRFRKLVMELTAPETVTLNFKQDFDYADGYYPNSENLSVLTYGTGGAFNESAWDTFHWSMPQQTQSEVNITGIGRNMSLLLWHESAVDDSFTLQGILIHYSILGMVR